MAGAFADGWSVFPTPIHSIEIHVLVAFKGSLRSYVYSRNSLAKSSGRIPAIHPA